MDSASKKASAGIARAACARLYDMGQCVPPLPACTHGCRLATVSGRQLTGGRCMEFCQ